MLSAIVQAFCHASCWLQFKVATLLQQDVSIWVPHWMSDRQAGMHRQVVNLRNAWCMTGQYSYATRQVICVEAHVTAAASNAEVRTHTAFNSRSWGAFWPVMLISSPGLASAKKFEQMPFFSGSSAFFSESQKVALRTQREVVCPSNWSPYREAAMEYNLVPWGTFFPLEFVFSPCVKEICVWCVSTCVQVPNVAMPLA
jgi:hypothetical protein